jgi:acyl carrier protein
LHVGSLEYAKGWGQRVVLVEVDPADVVSVPSECSCQKLRCCKYVVLAEYTGPMPDTLTTEFDDEDVCHQCGGPENECTCEQDENLVDNGATSGLPMIAVPPPNVTSETPDESWIREKAAVENKSTVAAGGLLGAVLMNFLSPKDKARIDAESNATYIKVRAILAEQLGLNETDIWPDERMDSGFFGMDSLDGVELAMAFEEEFQIEIPDEDAEKAISATVADICKYIEDRLERERARTVTPPADPNFLNGLAEGMQHRALKLPAIYFAGDVAGADSQSHGQYILGYVAGYDK